MRVPLSRLTEASIQHPVRVIVLLSLLTLAFAGQLPKLRTEFGYRPLVGENHPSIRLLDGFIERFGGGFPVQIAWTCRQSPHCETIFDPASLRMADAVSRRLASLAVIRDVRSPASSSLLVPTPEGFAVRQFVERGKPVDDARLLAERALDDPLWVGNLVSSDGRTGVIVVQPVDSESATSVQVVEAIREALAPFETAGFEFHLVGHSVEFVVAGRELAQSSALLTPVAALVIAVIIFALYRSWQSVLVSLATVLTALIWTFGLLGALRWPHDSILQTLAPLILVVGVCDAIHVLSRFAAERTPGTRPGERSGRGEALLAATGDIARPCLLTTLTTAGAFLSFATSDLQTFVHFGVVSAFGVLACLVLTFTLLPILLLLIPGEDRREAGVSRGWEAVLDAIVRMAERRAVPILVATGLVFCVCTAGWLGFLRVDTDGYEMYGDDSQVIRWIRFVEEHLHRSENLEIEIGLPPSAPLEKPETLDVISHFSKELSEIEGLGRATSFLDPIERLNRLLHDDDPAYECHGDSTEANAQLIELITLQDPALLEPWLSFDRSRVRISVEALFQSQTSRAVVLSKVHAEIARSLPEDWSAALTGQFAMGYDWVSDVQATQLRSFLTAFVIVFLLVAVHVRSIRWSLIAMVPTVLPVVVLLGCMGLLGLSLDVGRAMIAAVIIGIGVDDTVHLLSHFRDRRIAGATAPEAIRYAVLFVGRPVITSSLALAVGFLSLMSSSWQTVSSFGFFVGIGILGALVADLFVFPALVMAIAARAPGRGRDGDPAAGRVLPHRRAARIGGIFLPILVPLVLATALALIPGASSLPACRTLANGHIALFPAMGSDCPLQPFDQVRAVEPTGSSLRVALSRDRVEDWLEIPVRRASRVERLAELASAAVMAVAMMVIPCLLLRRAAASASEPFALFYSAVAGIVFCANCGVHSPWLDRLQLVASTIAPAALAHLILVFRSGRGVLRQTPALSRIPYLGAALLLPVAWTAMERDGILWPPVCYLLLALTVGLWILLLTSCAFSLRESDVPIERARARLVLYGTLLLPVVPALVVGDGSADASQFAARYLLVSAAFVPLPIGLAVSRYDLFNLGLDARLWAARFLFYSLAALAGTLALSIATLWVGESKWVPGPLRLFALCFAAAAMIDGVRWAVLGRFEAILLPDGEWIRSVRENFARRIAELHGEEEVASLLGDALVRALAPRSVCVFVSSATRLRPVFAFGSEVPLDRGVAESAVALTAENRTLCLAALPRREGGPESHLASRGVAMVSPLRIRERCIGIVVLAEARSGRSYTRRDLAFVEHAASHAAIALANARLADELVAAERRASAGRISVALAHDFGKELDWIRRLARRLPGRLADRERALRDIDTIRELSEELAFTVREFVRGAADAMIPKSGFTSAASLLDGVIRNVTRIHPGSSISQSAEPRVREVLVDRGLGQILANLLDNALRASPLSTPVHVFATTREGRLRVSITDRGPGMSSEEIMRAFEPGFSTRWDGGGCGIGLPICREIASGLSGSVELRRSDSGGICAVVEVPFRSPGAP
jgi:predicted RND superfamily exporter protein/signal transduction histidine kinase